MCSTRVFSPTPEGTCSGVSGVAGVLSWSLSNGAGLPPERPLPAAEGHGAVPTSLAALSMRACSRCLVTHRRRNPEQMPLRLSSAAGTGPRVSGVPEPRAGAWAGEGWRWVCFQLSAGREVRGLRPQFPSLPEACVVGGERRTWQGLRVIKLLELRRLC